MHWGLALQNQYAPCSVLRCPVFIPLCLCSTIAPRSSKLCASGVSCHLERDPCLTAVHLLRVRDTDYTLLRMQRSLGVWEWAWRRALPWSWGTLQFSLSGEDRRQWERGCLFLSLSLSLSLSLGDFLTKHNPANPQAPLKLDSIMTPVAGEVSREGPLLDLHTECSVSCCLQHCSCLLQCLCIWVRFSLICSYMPEMWVYCHSVVSKSFAAPWTVAHQAPLSMEFSRQEYWSGLPFFIDRNK